MRNIISYLEDPEKVKYPCLGGTHVLFVDWFFDVRPCMQLPNVLGNMLAINEKDFNRPACNDCNMSWYRDFSSMLFGIKSLPVWMESFGNLKLVK